MEAEEEGEMIRWMKEMMKMINAQVALFFLLFLTLFHMCRV